MPTVEFNDFRYRRKRKEMDVWMDVRLGWWSKWRIENNNMHKDQNISHKLSNRIMFAVFDVYFYCFPLIWSFVLQYVKSYRVYTFLYFFYTLLCLLRNIHFRVKWLQLTVRYPLNCVFLWEACKWSKRNIVNISAENCFGWGG